jgi:ParB family chromosome partitioning protein
MADDLKIKYVSTKHLEPYSGNSRVHSTDQIDQIVRSINEFGFTNPILLGDGNEVVAGHGRLQAALRLNLDFVPTITLEGLTKAQRKAYVIADNQLALNAGWDFDALRIEIEDLDSLDFNLGLLGFGEQELERILGIEEIPDADEFTGDSENKWQLLIEYNNENELATAYDEVTNRGLKCKIIQ